MEDRFEQKELTNPVLSLEELLVRAANGQEFCNQIKEANESVYKKVLILATSNPATHSVTVIKESSPSVKKVTAIRTINEAMETERVHKNVLPEVHKLICLYFTVPETTLTSERAFSVLKRLLTYLRSTMTACPEIVDISA